MTADVGAPPAAVLQRLHPLTPLLKGVRIFGVLAAIVSYQSYRSFQEVGVPVALSLALLLVAGAFVMSYVSWRFTGFRITDRELLVVEGVLARRSRTVPLERVQAVDVVRPVLARLLGLAEVRLEVVGSGGAEAPLAYLSVAEAKRVRGRLLAVATTGHVTAAGPVTADGTVAAGSAGAGTAPGVRAGADGTTTAPPGSVLYAVERRRMLIAQLLTPQVLLLPVVAVPSLGWALYELGLIGGGPPEQFARPGLDGPFSFAGWLGVLSAVVGLGQQAARRLVGDWGFTVSEAAEGLWLRHGLLETRTQTVPPERVQAVRIQRPLLWRRAGWVRVELDVAGYAPGESGDRTGVLLPVATVAEARAVLARVLPVDFAEVELVPAPRAAAWRAPVLARRLAVGLAGRAVVLRGGRLTEVTTVVPYARVQSVRTVQGPWQRALGLLSVGVDTAGRRIGAIAEHRGVVEGRALADSLAARTLGELEPVAPRGPSATAGPREPREVAPVAVPG